MLRCCGAVMLLLTLATAGLAADRPTPMIIDTDLGSDIDDALALALAIASPEVELAGVTTVGGDTTLRAKMALRMLHAAGLAMVPVAAGGAPQPASEITGQYQYYYHPAVLYNRAGQPQKKTAVEWLHAMLQQPDDKLTLVALGPLTNIARLLTEHPGSKDKIARIVVMGGSLAHDYDGKETRIAEHNIKSDIQAAQAVFSSGVPLVVVPLDVTWNMRLEAEARAKLFAKKSMLTMQVEALHQMWNQDTPVMFDPVAVASVIKEDLCTWDEQSLRVTDAGFIEVAPNGKANARVATKCDPATFSDWYVARVTAWGITSLPEKPKNETKLIKDNRFPARAHVFEDYETDIEKRWWLAGRPEETDLPAGSKRAFRSQLTMDFDDLQGQLNTMYNAVVFNPVPGPVMGPNTRLKFRYRLQGTDTLRVQIYSLANGYHRYLSLAGLPQNEWREATVDMTAARRPDGSGGALAKDERIDDIQFYVDPRARVLIDDVILYDAGAEDEGRPFPQRLVFTAGFDTGKQGQEWPGTYEIVPHEKPGTWKYAQSVLIDGKPTLIVSLRGKRTVSNDTKLSLRYHFSGAPSLTTVRLQRAGHDSVLAAELAASMDDAWHSATLSFPKLSKPITIDQIHFDLSPGTVLRVDDLLLYEP